LINRQKIYSRLYRCGVKIITSSEPANLDKLEEGLVVIYNIYSGVAEDLTDISSITYSCSRSPNDGLVKPLEDGGYNVVRVGDCFAPRSLLAATGQGFEVGCAV
jgi:hypothetical protein